MKLYVNSNIFLIKYLCRNSYSKESKEEFENFKVLAGYLRG